jgi:DNA-binding transcriptional regulator YdaS (Cro superfamily)
MPDFVSQLVEKAADMAGSQRRLAKAAGLSHAGIWQIINSGEISVEAAIKIERATSGEVTREQLRPDLFKGFKREN